MNTVEIESQSIEFVFENCETIHIDVWAIENLYFETGGERFTFDSHRKDLLKSINMTDFYIKLDLTNPKHFYHTNRLKDDNLTTEQDGEQCIKDGGLKTVVKIVFGRQIILGQDGKVVFCNIFGFNCCIQVFCLRVFYHELYTPNSTTC